MVNSSSGCCWCHQSAVFLSQLFMSTAGRGNMENIIRDSVLSTQYPLRDQTPPYLSPPADHSNSSSFIIHYIVRQWYMVSGHLYFFFTSHKFLEFFCLQEHLFYCIEQCPLASENKKIESWGHKININLCTPFKNIWVSYIVYFLSLKVRLLRPDFNQYPRLLKRLECKDFLTQSQFPYLICGTCF